MKDKLIEYVNEMGFTSKIIGKSVNSMYSSKDFYYLWLCELQKWCRDTQYLDVFISSSIKENHYDWDIYSQEEESTVNHCEEPYADYQDALEIGLYEACKIIKEKE